MHLGHGVSSLELRVTGYQFPDRYAVGERPRGDSSDANWLVVSGEVRTATGGSWSFRDPSLLTAEVTDLVSWLRQVADGAVSVATAVGELDKTTLDKCVDEVHEYAAAGWLTFTEPNLSFAVVAYSGSRVQLVIGLSHESAAPRVDLMRPNRSQITVMSDSQHVKDAADALHEQLTVYPAR